MPPGPADTRVTERSFIAPAIAARAGRAWIGVVLAVCACAGLWWYGVAWFAPARAATLAATGLPSGTGPTSDWYATWAATRATLFEHRDPYGPQVTGEIQRLFYGRPLTPEEQQAGLISEAFVYPLPVVWVQWPLALLPWPVAYNLLYVLILLLAAAGALAWWAAIVPRPAPRAAAVAWVVLVAFSLPNLNIWLLQQPTAWTVASLAGAQWLLAGAGRAPGGLDPRRGFAAGACLALATLKPQLALPVVVWLLAWALWRPRRRWPLAAGWALTLGLGWGAADLWLPGWEAGWLTQLAAYGNYAFSGSLLGTLLPAVVTVILQILMVGIGVVAAWRWRDAAPATLPHHLLWAWALLLPLLLFPSVTAYNQLQLAPAILLLVLFEPHWRTRRGPRLAARLALVAAVWPWVAAPLVIALGLAGIPLTPPLINLPWVASLILPILLTVPLILLGGQQFAHARGQPAPAAG
jgi:hypothetical protein